MWLTIEKKTQNKYKIAYEVCNCTARAFSPLGPRPSHYPLSPQEAQTAKAELCNVLGETPHPTTLIGFFDHMIGYSPCAAKRRSILYISLKV